MGIISAGGRNFLKVNDLATIINLCLRRIHFIRLPNIAQYQYNQLVDIKDLVSIVVSFLMQTYAEH